MSPGTRLGRLLQVVVDKHFDEEIKTYCERHNMKPAELEINMTPTRDDKIVMTLGPLDQRLILPRRRWKFTVKMSDAF